MAKLHRFLALLLSIEACQASIQEVLISGSKRAKYTLDDIIPSYFEKSGVTKCCPVGTDFDGEACQLATPYCGEPDTRREGDKCVSISGPRCKGHTVPFHGVCITKHNATCTGGFEVRGNTCISPDPPQCDPGFVQHGNTCVSRIPPQCRGTGQFKDGKCVSPIPPQCPPDTELCTGTCVAHATCGDNLVVDDVTGLCISRQRPQCPDKTEPDGDVCVSIHGPDCGELKYDPASHLCTSRERPKCADETFELINGVCKKFQDPTCPSGSDLAFHEPSNSARCCPSEYKWDGNMCYIPVPPDGKCPDDTVPHEGKCRRVPTQKPDCHLGYELKGTQCVRTTKPRCPEGTDPIDGVCVSQKKPECPRDTRLVGDRCISNTDPTCPGATKPEGDKCISRRKPTCDEKQGFYLVGDKCVLRTPPECKEGHLKDDDCVVGLDIVCPENTTPVGNQCVSKKQPQCTGGTVPDGDGYCLVSVTPTCAVGTPQDGKCVVDTLVCDDNTRPENGLCVSEVKPRCPDPETYTLINGKCEYKVQPCDSGFIPKDGKCVSLVDPDCGSKGKFNGTACVGEEPACPDDTTYEPPDCVSNKDVPRCPDGSPPKDMKCVVKTDPDCPDGFTKDPTTKECFSSKPPACPEHQVFKDGHCVLEDGTCMDFEFEYCPNVPSLVAG